MKVLVVYDSAYGNTEKIARAIGDAISGDVRVVRAGQASSPDLEAVELLIVGSPTQGFRPTKPVQAFIRSIPGASLASPWVAAFDTRMPQNEVGRALGLLMKMGGYAAPRIAQALEKKGGRSVVPPEGFYVLDREGPLKEGELERAAAWARSITEKTRGA